MSRDILTNFDGFSSVDTLTGWVWDENRPDECFVVELQLNGESVISCLADAAIDDRRKSGRYFLKIPHEYLDGKARPFGIRLVALDEMLAKGDIYADKDASLKKLPFLATPASEETESAKWAKDDLARHNLASLYAFEKAKLLEEIEGVPEGASLALCKIYEKLANLALQHCRYEESEKFWQESLNAVPGETGSHAGYLNFLYIQAREKEAAAYYAGLPEEIKADSDIKDIYAKIAALMNPAPGLFREYDGKLPSDGISITAIVTNLNQGRYLTQRFQSILNQTRLPDEILVIDGGSTDSSLAIIDRFLKASPVPCRLIQNTAASGKLFKQWLQGISEARGQFIWICEAADYCKPEFLANIAIKFQDPDINLVWAGSLVVDESGQPEQERDGENLCGAVHGQDFPRCFTISGPEFLMTCLRAWRHIPSISAAAFRKSALPGDGEFAAGCTQADTWTLYLQTAQRGKAACLSEPMNYRRKSGQILDKQQMDGSLLIQTMLIQLETLIQHPDLFDFENCLKILQVIENQYRVLLYANGGDYLYCKNNPIFSRVYNELLSRLKLNQVVFPQGQIINDLENTRFMLDVISNSPFFDAGFYLTANPDLAAAGVDPAIHYLETGAVEGRMPMPSRRDVVKRFFKKKDNPVLYLERNREKQPLLYKQLKIWRDIDFKNYNIIRNSAWFDRDFYLSRNKDVRKANLDPALHYFLLGQDEDRCYSMDFEHVWRDITPGPLGTSLLGWERYGKLQEALQTKATPRRLTAEAADHSVIPIDQIKKIIENPGLTTVSFDIFDTLLCRPCLEPSDIFTFTSIVLYKEHGIRHFADMRKTAEAKAGDSLLNFDEIYEFMRLIYKIPFKTLQLMKETELKIEKQLLSRREEVYGIYRHALKLGKRVIAVSDMYLSSEYLSEILRKNGYDKIETVYVSNECGCGKGDGLFEHVLEKEGLDSSEVAHIGDNIVSDYYEAQKLGITSIFYPKATDLLLWRTMIGKDFQAPQDIFARMIMGFVFNQAASNFDHREHFEKHFANWEELVQLGIFPLLLAIGLYILNCAQIQNGYGQVLFASRDGYQPKNVYDRLRRAAGGLRSKYVYAGRRAYEILTCETGWDLINTRLKDILARPIAVPDFEEVLAGAIPEAALRERIIARLGGKIGKDYPMPGSEAVRKIITLPELIQWFEKAKQEARAYYATVSDAGSSREVIFDCGYAGSVSTNLTAALNKHVDKIYLYGFEKNREQDRKNKTVTFQILNGRHIPPLGVNLLWEELYAPLAGGCVGFKDGVPIYEDIAFSPQMSAKFQSLSEIVSVLTDKFCSLFEYWLKIFCPYDYFSLQKLLLASLLSHDHSIYPMLDDVCFPDPSVSATLDSLAAKIADGLEIPNKFHASAFDNPDNFHEHMAAIGAPKIGIHIHIHDIIVVQEILAFFREAPYHYDLYITYDSDRNLPLLKSFLSKIDGNSGKIVYIKVPNRGRDVAPWCIYTRQYQFEYDYFCHIHSKASPQASWATDWRHYLYRHLVSRRAFLNNVKALTDNPQLGCVFPPAYPVLKEYCVNHGIDQFGEYGEKAMIDKLLKRMGIEETYKSWQLYYSMGTMLWYRPEALRQLFEFELAVEEFDQEPIGIGGSIGHAIERLPAFICRHNGYDAKMLLANERGW